MKKAPKKLRLSRDTLMNLSGQAVQQAAAAFNTAPYCNSARCTFYVTCPPTCAYCTGAPTCLTCPGVGC